MAEIQEKNPSVELDTDGVNDQVIDVETPKESTSEFQQKEEVDLGYTDVSGKKTAKELLQEVKESEKETKQAEPKFEQRYEEKDSEPSDLEDYSEKVQKRIKRLTFQIRKLKEEKELPLIMRKV